MPATAIDRARRRASLGRSLHTSYLAIAAVSVWASITLLRARSNQCDNLAGTCIRMRQQAAIVLIDATGLVFSATLIFTAVALARGARASRLRVALLVLGGAFAVAVLAVDPITHLNNNRSGWLGGQP